MGGVSQCAKTELGRKRSDRARQMKRAATLRLFFAVAFVAISSSWGFAAHEVGPTRARRALHELENWLATSAHRAAWRSYLQLDVLQHQIASTSPDVDQLATLLSRFAAEKRELRHAPIVRLRHALEGWLALESLPDGPHLMTAAESIARSSTGRRGHTVRPRLVGLTLLLTKYARDPKPHLADAIGENLDWLATIGQAEPFVTAVRQYYSQPNVWIDVSQSALVRAVEGAVDRDAQITDYILGTEIDGRARTQATTRLTVVPHSTQARMSLVVTGTIDSQTVGSNGPARIHNRSSVTFRAQKSLILDAGGLRASPATCVARTITYEATPTAVVPGVRGWVVRRIASRRVRRLQRQADEIASRHAEQRIAALIDREADKQIAEISQFAVGPLAALAGGDRSRLRFSSDAGVLRIGAIAGPLGAPPHGATFARQHPYSLRLHATLLDRLRNHPVADVAVASLGLGDGMNSAVAWLFPTARAAAGTTARGTAWANTLALLGGGRSPSSAKSFMSQPLFYRLEIDRLLGGWLNWAFNPRIGQEGIALREGQLGTLSPIGFASEWTTVGWSPPALEERLAMEPRERY